MKKYCVETYIGAGSKYIHFVKVEDKPKTSVWECRNNRSGDVLGKVKWYPAWRKYCYFPVSCTVYSNGCLQDIVRFIDFLEKERKSLKKLRKEN